MSYPILDIEPASYVAKSDLSAPGSTSYVLNQRYWNPSTGKVYRFIYNFGADSIVAGDVVSQATPYVAGYVSNTAASILDFTDGTTTRPKVRGIGVAPIATAKYGFIQCGGPNSNVTTDGNVVAGDPLTTTDGAKIATREVSAATNHFMVWGWAPVADTSTSLTSIELNLD